MGGFEAWLLSGTGSPAPLGTCRLCLRLILKGNLALLWVVEGQQVLQWHRGKREVGVAVCQHWECCGGHRHQGGGGEVSDPLDFISLT